MKHTIEKSKANLAFSQALLDQLRGTNMAQQSQPMEQPQPVEQPQQAPQPTQQPTQESPQEEPKEMGMLQGFMNEIRTLFKGKEDEEKKTQQLVEQHNKEMDEIKQGLSDLLNEESKEN